jgi:hypothetical protein
MYSTLLFLDRPRHLRYDMQAVLDLDQLLLGGFESVFSMEADMSALKLIYWVGLKHEDTHLRTSGEGGTGDILQNAMVSGPWTCESLVRQFTKAVLSDGWISPPKPKTERVNADGEKFTIQDYILRLESLNYEYVKLKPKDFYGITPREFHLMLDVAGTVGNQRAGMICATVANCSGAKKAGGGAFKVDDFFYIKPKVVKESVDTIKNKMRAAFGEAVG